MNRPYPPTSPNKDVLTTNEVRQASGKTSNFRVLTMSMALAAAVGFLLVGMFWFATPKGVEGVPPAPPSAGLTTPVAPAPETSSPPVEATPPSSSSDENLPAEPSPLPMEPTAPAPPTAP